MQIYSKNNKNCFFSLISWPIFILFVLSDRARWRLQNLYTKFWNSLIMLIYANLRSPGRDPGVQSAFFLFKKKYYYFLFFFFMSLPGRQIYIFLTLIFLFSCPFPGHQIFIFWPVENCTTWNLWYLMLRDAGWALRHWRSGFFLQKKISVKITIMVGVYPRPSLTSDLTSKYEGKKQKTNQIFAKSLKGGGGGETPTPDFHVELTGENETTARVKVWLNFEWK